MGGDEVTCMIRSEKINHDHCRKWAASRVSGANALSSAGRLLCPVAILISVFSAPTQAQTSGEIEASLFSISPPTPSLPFSACGRSADECSPNSVAVIQNGLSPKPVAVIQNGLNETDPGGGSSNSQQDDWVHAWLRKVDWVRANQPHFVSPIVTTHVLLVEQFRYDMSWQQDPTGNTITSNYGASRGLEIIPTTRLEVGIFPPNYLVHESKTPDGFGDLSWQVKFRAFSAPEGKGDYFVGLFLGGSFPTGTQPNGLGHTVLSPTFAAAKGLGPWDIQSTIGANLPTSGTNLLGRMIIFNTAVDYRIKGKIWPMLEQNSTFWSGGTLDGKKQVFLTPGLILGSFPLAERLHFTFGGGVQIAATQFHQFNHRWILSVRFPF
jgi:hypothetical protein